MSTISYLIKKGTDEAVLFSTARITNAVLSLRANGVDAFTFTQQDDWLDDPAWPYKTHVVVIERTVDGETVTDVCRFAGTVRTVPRSAVGGGQQAITYVAYGPSYDLQRCGYSQVWAYLGGDGTTKTQREPTVVLGEDDDGNRISNGAAVALVIDWAIERGVEIAKGTIADGVRTPLDERDNLKCWDAIVTLLRYTPDYQFFWDYDNLVDGVYVPKAMLLPPGAMSSVIKAAGAAGSAEFSPREDLRVPGIVVVYRWVGDVAGKTVKQRSTQTAGDIDDPERQTLIFDLDGMHATYLEQAVEVESYPTDFNSSGGKTFLEKMIPRLSDLDSYSVIGIERSGEKTLGARLVKGAITDWIKESYGRDSESETFTVEIEFEKKSTETGNTLDKGRQKLTFNSVSTDAFTQTYRVLQSYQSREAAPPDLAYSLYLSWNRLHYDGRLQLIDQTSLFDARPGRLLRVTGGLDEWETMDTLIQQADIDIGKGTCSLTCGTCGRLEADDLMALYRAARGRRFSYRRGDRLESEANAGDQSAGLVEPPNDNVGDGAPPCRRTYLAVENKDSGNRMHRVVIDPSSIAFATSGNAAAQTLQIREFLIPYDDAGTVKAKLCQVLCGASYGTAVELGNGVKMSIIKDSADGNKLKLSGDVDSPGNYYVYATSGIGTKGWLQGVQISF